MVPGDLAILSQEQLIAEAARLAEQLRSHRKLTKSGSLTWLTPTGYGTELSPLVVKQAGYELHSGLAGIALFLAAFARVSGDADFRQLCLDAVAPLRRQLAGLLADAERASRANLWVGALYGLGSFVYGLLAIGELLGDPELLNEAHEAISLITPKRITADERVRVQSGSAGALLVLLALHKRRPEANSRGVRALDLARVCADHLLATRVSFDGRPRAWALSPGKIPLPGFSYGAAGISLALLRLHAEIGDATLLEAAEEGQLFLRSLYCAEHGRWEDLRPVFQLRYRPRRGTWTDWWFTGTLDDLEPIPPPPGEAPEKQFSEAWCHGSAGIALGRIASLPFADSTETRAEIHGAMDGLCQALERDLAAADTDDLCCGQCGRVEALLSGHLQLGEPRYGDAALGIASRLVRRAHEQGRYTFAATHGSDVFSPSLFSGVAGVGYTLLRLARPRELPAVLLFE